MDKHVTPFSGTCRYIVTDIDFTFLGFQKQMLAENLAAVKKVQAAGIPLAFATGRYWPSMREWVEMMNLTAPQVLDNGATLFDPVARQVLNCAKMTAEACRYFYMGLREAGYSPVICTPGEYYSTKLDEDSYNLVTAHKEYTVVLDSDEELLAAYGDQAVKVSAYTSLREDHLHTVVEQLVDEGRKKHYPFSAVFTESGIVVVTAEDVTKITGIRMAAERLGISLGDIAAIGDGDNDASMLAECGLGIAMGNATDLAKACATHVVGTCDEAGFAQAIETILNYGK